MTKPHLISFELCPFVQRATIMLAEKNVEYDITYIDLKNKPDWFLEISPFGKVPVLKIGEEVIFESAVIVEYLNEVNEPSMHPSDPILKAKNRAWVEFASSMNMHLHMMSMAKEESAYLDSESKMQEALGRLESNLQDGPFFNGAEFMIVDISFTPFFQRLHLIVTEAAGNDVLSEFPKIKKWSEACLARPSLVKSVVPDFKEKLLAYAKSADGYLARSI